MGGLDIFEALWLGMWASFKLCRETLKPTKASMRTEARIRPKIKLYQKYNATWAKQITYSILKHIRRNFTLEVAVLHFIEMCSMVRPTSKAITSAYTARPIF